MLNLYQMQQHLYIQRNHRLTPKWFSLNHLFFPCLNIFFSFTCNLNLPSFSLKLLRLALPLQTLAKSLTPLSCTCFKHWNTTISPQNNPKCLSLPSKENPSSSVTVFMALLWSYSKRSVSVLYPGSRAPETAKGQNPFPGPAAFGFRAASTCCWIRPSFSPTNTPRWHHPVCIYTGDGPDPCAGSRTWPRWMSWGEQ